MHLRDSDRVWDPMPRITKLTQKPIHIAKSYIHGDRSSVKSLILFHNVEKITMIAV